MQNLILKTIKTIETEKREMRRVPSYCTFYELGARLNLSETKILNEIEKLQMAGVSLNVGRTKNSNYIALQKVKNYL